MNLAITYITYDGLTSLYSGVGTTSHDFLLSFKEIKPCIEQSINGKVDFYPACIHYSRECFGYSGSVKSNTLKEISEQDYEPLTEILNDSNGDVNYGNVHNWTMASMSAATFISTLARRYDLVIAITVDTPFAGCGYYYFRQFPDDKRTKIVWLAQSTVLAHRPEPLTDSREKRYNWEALATETANQNKNMFIGAISSFMKNHLIKRYNVDAGKVLNMINGLYFPRMRDNIVDQCYIETRLQELGIPTNQPLLFSFGRGERYKGFDIVLRAGRELQNYGFMTLLLVSPYSMNDSIVRELRSISDSIGDCSRVIFDLDFVTPHLLMQWRYTYILSILSRYEPAGLIPAEARFYNNPFLTLLVSDRGGLPEQIENGKNGFITDLDDNSVIQSMTHIARLDFDTKKDISEAGYKFVTSKYSYVTINREVLLGLID